MLCLLRNWNETLFYAFFIFEVLLQREIGMRRQHKARQERCRFRFRARWNETHDVPFKPTSAAGLFKYTCFFSPLFLVFTSISLCNISAWSRLLWPTVSLLGLSWRGVFTLYFLTTLLPLRKVECSLRILSLFIFDCLCIPLTFSQINLSCSIFFFLPSPPSTLDSLSCWPSLWLLVPILHCFCMPIPLFLGDPAVCWAWCPAICAGVAGQTTHFNTVCMNMQRNI